MPNSTLTILRQARDRIADESHWTHGAWARSAPGDERELDAEDPKATCWCVGGAIFLASGDYGIPESELPRGEAVAAWDLLTDVVGRTELTTWNDSGTHAEVLRALDRAIEIAATAVAV